MTNASAKTYLIFFVLLFFCACSGGSSGDGSSSNSSGAESANFGCDGSCANSNLTSSDVEQILNQSVNAASALGVSATLAIVDRVGNVLALYAMDGANPSTRIDGQIGASGGLEGLTVPASLAAISKAGTGAYLSSQGNAFTSRTASQIIQEHFNPGEEDQPGGPLFGVQFSQLVCSDINLLNPDLAAGISSGSKPRASGLSGPRHLPLGLSADPGGIPLYKQGDLVGGLGVEFDGLYSLDRDVQDKETNLEETLALYASAGFEAPAERSGSNIFAAGKSLRYTDPSYGDLEPLPDSGLSYSPGNLLALSLYSSGQIRAGAVYGTAASGVFKTVRVGVPAAFLVDGAGNARFPTRSGSALPGAAELKSNEVDAILDSALLTGFRARAAIRTPRDTQAHVSIFVVDTLGNILGMTRTQDGPIFGADVAAQKARTAAFFSAADAGQKLSEIRSRNTVGNFQDYAGLTSSFFGFDIFSGAYAISNRAVANIARPFFTDGIVANSNGPLSLPFPGRAPGASWSPFNTGLQLDLVFQRVAQSLSGIISDACVDSGVVGNRLRNGIQIFPGAVPLYRGATLIGAIGVSGDGVDQDELVAFFGASRQGLDYAGHVSVGDPIYGFNAPREIRSDNILGPIPNTRLRYVNCPESPFRDSNEQNVCEGL